VNEMPVGRINKAKCVADPGSGAFLTPGSGIRCFFDPRIRIRDGEKSGSGIRNLVDPGSRMEKFGTGISIPDPQHC